MRRVGQYIAVALMVGGMVQGNWGVALTFAVVAAVLKAYPYMRRAFDA